MFWNNFPYSDVHNINLDWIIKTVKMLFNSAVFSINGHTPDAEGDVQLTGAELGAVGTVNGKSPDSNGNVEVGTVRKINNQTPNAAGEIEVGKVRTVNGFAPDAQGEVKAGTIRSVNGKSPTSMPTPGAITLNASDVHALPDTMDPVESVNGLTPDANGNVNVGTVKSVNNTSPDADGNVNLPTVAGVTSVNGIGPDGDGNVDVGTVKSVNGVSPDANGALTLLYTDVGVTPIRYYVDGVNGNDSNDGKTAGTAFKTINKALTLIAQSDMVPSKNIIQIASGTYNELVSAFIWANKYINFYANGGDVTISGMRVIGAQMLHFTSSDNSQYGFKFVKGTASSGNLLNTGFEKVYTECPIEFNPSNDSNLETLNITLGSQFIIGYRGQLTFTNVAKATCFNIDGSILINTWSSITATPTTYNANHAIVQGVGNLTATGTALTI